MIEWAARDAVRRPGAGRGAARSAPSSILELQRLAGNRAVAGVLQRAPDDDDPYADEDTTTKAPPKHVTGYLGLNPQAAKEATALKGASREEVLVSLNNPVAEKVLKENPAVFDFVETELGIDITDFARWNKATDVLLNADPHLRDQLSDLMRWFNRAEQGEIVLDRLVLSGHSNGVELWGEAEGDAESKPGTMVIERDLQTLTAVFPKATAGVEDVMFSACFSINAVEIVVRMFPNLKNCWSYGGFSPDIAGGSGTHIAAFAAATEGEGKLRKTDKRGSNALWTKEQGYIVGDPSQAAVGPLFTEVVRGWRELAQPMLAGEKDVPKATLDPYYLKVQELLVHPHASKDQKDEAQQAMDLVLRLRFWDKVRRRFGAEHGTELKAAYDAIGVSLPDWGSLTRVQLKAHLEAVDAALKAHEDKPEAKATIDRLLRQGLWRLDKEVIKPDWI